MNGPVTQAGSQRLCLNVHVIQRLYWLWAPLCSGMLKRFPSVLFGFNSNVDTIRSAPRIRINSPPNQFASNIAAVNWVGRINFNVMLMFPQCVQCSLQLHRRRHLHSKFCLFGVHFKTELQPHVMFCTIFLNILSVFLIFHTGCCSVK